MQAAEPSARKLVKAMPDTSFAYLSVLVVPPSLLPSELMKGSSALSGGGKVVSVNERKVWLQLSLPLPASNAPLPEALLFPRLSEKRDEAQSAAWCVRNFAAKF